jgi:hypothetical protein
LAAQPDFIEVPLSSTLPKGSRFVHYPLPFPASLSLTVKLLLEVSPGAISFFLIPRSGKKFQAGFPV